MPDASYILKNQIYHGWRESNPASGSINYTFGEFNRTKGYPQIVFENTNASKTWIGGSLYKVEQECKVSIVYKSVRFDYASLADANQRLSNIKTEVDRILNSMSGSNLLKLQSYTSLSYPRSMCYYNGYIYILGSDVPDVYKINPDDLNDISSVALTTSNNVNAILYASGSLWCVGSSGSNGVNTSLFRVNPETMVADTAVYFGTTLKSGSSLCYDYGRLWVGGASIIAKVDLGDLSYTLIDYSNKVAGGCFRTLTSDHKGFIWGTTDAIDASIFLRFSASTYASGSTNIAVTLSDGACYYNNNFYCSSEGSTRFEVYKLTDARAITSGSQQAYAVYDIYQYGGYIWAALNGTTNSNLIKVDPTNLKNLKSYLVMGVSNLRKTLIIDGICYNIEDYVTGFLNKMNLGLFNQVRPQGWHSESFASETDEEWRSSQIVKCTSYEGALS